MLKEDNAVLRNEGESLKMSVFLFFSLTFAEYSIFSTVCFLS